MKIKLLAAFAALMLVGCPNTSIMPVEPPPSPNPDVKADCSSACENIGPVTDENPDGLACEEGEPTADGASCTEVCEGIPNTTQDYLDCVATITACDQISKCPR